MKRLLIAAAIGLFSTNAWSETISCEGVREDKVKVQIEIVNYERSTIAYVHPVYGVTARQGFVRDLLRETDGEGVYYVTESKPHRRVLFFPRGTEGSSLQAKYLAQDLEMNCSVYGDLAEEIEKPAPITCSKRDYEKVLFEGIESGRVRDVEEALSCGVSPNKKNGRGCTAFLFATDLYCGENLPQKILGDEQGRWTKGAQVPGNQNPISPVLGDVLDLMVNRGALLDARDPKNGETPLHKLIRNHGDSDLIARFLENEPDVDAQDLEGNTALMWATTLSTINFEAYAAIQELAAANASRTLKNKSNLTAYDIAKGLGLSEKNRGYDHEYDQRILRLLKPASRSVTIVGRDGECSPLSIEIAHGESVEFRLEASEKMYLMTAPGLSINLMAMRGEIARQVITGTQSAIFEFGCGIHGAEKQSKGTITVR